MTLGPASPHHPAISVAIGATARSAVAFSLQARRDDALSYCFRVIFPDRGASFPKTGEDAPGPVCVQA
jgi:hypothetical protein